MYIEKILLNEENENVYLDAYIADKISSFTRKAILVIPGGAYRSICSEREGEPIAIAFLNAGFNAFVLHYSVIDNNDNLKFPTQLIEASRAIKHIKDNAERYGIDKEQLFVTGFSAGGHLCASIGILWDLPEIYAAIDMPYGYNKPTGILPIYPVVTCTPPDMLPGTLKNLLRCENPTSEMLDKVCLEKHVNEQSSPMFLLHTANDTSVPVFNSLALAKAYAEANLTFELHIYPDAPHGVALGNNITKCDNDAWVDSAIASWIDSAVYWMEHLPHKAKYIKNK